ncbi:GNAT family acetyltransferase, partial [Pseudomonas sp. NZIPFR-PS2]
PTYERLQARLAEDGSPLAAEPIAVHCGWGRLLIGHTFPAPASLAQELLNEQAGERDIALYVAAPQQILGIDPQQLFLDPSDTLRLWFSDYRPATRVFRGFRIRRVQSEADWLAVNQLYQGRGMLPVDAERLTPRHQGGPVYWLAEDEDSGAVIGSVMGLNHQKAFHDPENGCSLWCLAVDPQCTRPGVGEVLDQPLFLGPGPQAEFNPYARIIVEEAHRRGIDVQVDDADAGLFTLSHGGRRVRCRESLSDLTSAISMTLCQDKSLTHKVLKAAGLKLPSQQLAGSADDNLDFLDEHQRIVVKPLDGEQGQGVAVDLQSIEEVQQAIETARQFDSRVLLESFHEGLDLRILVIGFEVVAAAIRRPAEVTGDGHHSIGALIEAQSRRRQAATDGESKIPLDGETERTLQAAGFDYSSILPRGQTLAVRRTANLHTGGCLEDVTDILHPTLVDAAVRAARALDIPMVGLDLMVPAADQPEYVFIEANERAGLANHEPQPTAEKFVDLLFPHS